MKEKSIYSKSNVEGINLKILQISHLIDIDVMMWVRLKDNHSDELVIQKQHKHLLKQLKQALWGELDKHKDVWSPRLYHVDMDMNGRTLIKNGRCYGKLNLCLYMIENTILNHQEMLEVITPMFQRLLNDPNFVFECTQKKNKELLI